MIYFLLILSLFQQPGEWVNFMARDNSFTVQVPGDMTFSEKVIGTGVGPVTLITYNYQSNPDEDPNAVYTVQQFAYPESTFPEDSTDLKRDFLINTIDQSLTTLNGSLDYKEEIKLGEHPGVLYRIKYNQKQAVMKSKAFLIDDVVYVLQVFAPIDRSLNKEMDIFLDSFLIHSKAE